MKPITAFRLAFAASSAALLLSLTAAPTQAITRHCQAHYSVDFPGPGGTTFPVPDFSAAGSCSAATPNRCREIASGRAHTCMQRMWDTRWTKPAHLALEECTSQHGVSGHTILQLKKSIEMAACCTLGSPLRNGSGTVKVSRLTFGDKGCGDGKIGFGEVPPNTGNPAGQYDVKIVKLSNCPAIQPGLLSLVAASAPPE